jgi:hypothetical protein
LTESEFLAYVGAAAGLLGAVTGIAGAVMGFVSYRRSNEMKALDLRLQLAKVVLQLFHEIDGVGELIERARKSRIAVSAATGRRGSEAFERFIRQAEADEASLAVLNEAFDELNVDHSDASETDLEHKIVEAHALETTLGAIRERYTTALAEDDRDRDQIREDHRARGAARSRDGHNG